MILFSLVSFYHAKLVDENGNPLVVYHGTNAEFEAFIPSPNGVFGPGAYFTKYDGDAATYGNKVLPVYLSIQNPLNMSMGDFRRLRSEGVNISQWAEDRKAEGFDGVVTDDMSVIVAFSPTQIKSVNNRGTFDANDSRIYYQSVSDYAMTHRPPSPEDGAPLHDVTGNGEFYPADVYSEKGLQYYGTGDRKADKESLDIIKRVRGKPEAEVTIYRAIPDLIDGQINSGDWVTLSKTF